MKSKLIILFSFLLIINIFVFACNGTNQSFKRKNMVPEELDECEMPELANGYNLVWCDEFNYEGAIDNTKWSHEIGTGNGGWGNQESQYYTNRLENSYVSDGTLKIVAKKESYGGSNYTSARLVSRGKGDFKYGLIEIRAQLPEGRGTWPALWMMPTTSEYGGWPNSGEIDIMEAVGSRQNTVLGTLHSGAYYGGNGRGKTISVANTSTTFNLYQLEWSEDAITFLVNGTAFYTLNNTDQWKNSENGYMYYPYDQQFYLIMNVAMGGTLGGSIDSSFSESSMIIDYVRVYEKHDEEDTTDPEIPEIDNYYATSSTIHLEWNDVVDNVGIKQYEIVVDNKQVAATINKSYTLQSLEPDTTYKVRLIAVDWQDNYSMSKVYSIRTSGFIDLPGNINAVSYASVLNGTIIYGTADEGEKILKLQGNANVSYEIKCKETSDYKITFRVSILKLTQIKIYLVEENSKTEITTYDLTATYGRYADIVVLDSTEITKGDYTLLIEATGDSVDSILLNYIKVEKE